MVASVTEQNKQIIRDAFARSPLSGASVSEGEDPYTPSCVFHGAAELFRSSKPDRDYVRAFPNLRLQIDDMIAEGDRVVTHLSGSGTQLSEFRGVPATGRRVGLRVIVISRLLNGQIVEEWGTLSWE